MDDETDAVEDMTCNWVGNFPGPRCKIMGVDGMKAHVACPGYCRDKCGGYASASASAGSGASDAGSGSKEVLDDWQIERRLSAIMCTISNKLNLR